MRLKANRQALRVTLIYLSVAVCWILVSDELVRWLVGNPDLRAEIFTFKGWAFVLVTGGWLYLAVRAWMRGWEQEARKKLLESEVCFRQLFELASDAVFLLDCETHRFVDANQSAHRIYGYSREEFLKMTMEGIADGPEQSHAIVGSGSQFVPLRWHRKKSGERFPVEVNSKVFSCQGRFLKLATIRDTTSRQEVLDMLEETTGQLLETQHVAGLGCDVSDLEGLRRN